MKTKLAQSFFLLSADPVSAFKFPARLPCPSKYVMDTSTNQCVLDTSTVFDWTCNADGTLTINNLHVDHFLEDYSSSAGALNGALNIFSKNSSCVGPKKSVSYTNLFLDSVTFAKNEVCASDFKLDTSTGKTIIEYKITADYPVPGSLTPHSLIVGCAFNKKVKATYEPNFDSASVPAAGASAGPYDIRQPNFGGQILETKTFNIDSSGVQSTIANEPVAIGQNTSFSIGLPSYLSGLSAKMRVDKCTATSKTPLSTASRIFYQRRCANPGDNTVPTWDAIKEINIGYKDDASIANGWINTAAELTFKAFTIALTDAKYGVKMDCDVTICHTSDTDPACKYLC